jgi:hypothetical protein
MATNSQRFNLLVISVLEGMTHGDPCAGVSVVSFQVMQR